MCARCFLPGSCERILYQIGLAVRRDDPTMWDVKALSRVLDALFVIMFKRRRYFREATDVNRYWVVSKVLANFLRSYSSQVGSHFGDPNMNLQDRRRLNQHQTN